MVKKILLIKRIVCFCLIIYLCVILLRNFNFLRIHISQQSFQVIEGNIIRIEAKHNRIFILKSVVVYTDDDKIKNVELDYTISDSVGTTIELVQFEDKVIRNIFVFSWADLYCITIIILLIYCLDLAYKKQYQRALANYAKKIYYRQKKKGQEE